MGILFKLLRKHSVPYKGFFSVFLTLSLIVSVAAVFMTRLTGDMSQAAVELDTGALLGFVGVFTGLMLIRAAASALSTLLLWRFSGKTDYRFREDFAKYFLQKPFAAFDGSKSGEILSIFTNDLPLSVQLVSSGGISMIADIIGLIATFAYLFYLNWWLTLIFISTFPLLIVIQSLVAGPIQQKSAKNLEAKANINTIANDSFQNTSLIVVYSLDEVINARCHTAFEAWISTIRDMARSYLVLILVGMLASLTPFLLIVGLSASQVINGNLTFVAWVVYIGLVVSASNWLIMLSQRQNNIQTAAGGAMRMIDAMSEEDEDIYKGSTLSPSGNTAISAVDLSFTYGDDIETGQMVLDNVSFEIKRGSRVALVGSSGSGKSTILKLLLGVYSPQKGKLQILGSDYENISLESLRSSFAYVPQDCFLFPESIRKNITGSDAEILMRLDKYAIDKTVIMVAHRVSAISFCDTIIVLDNGKIASIGSHDRLIESCPVYIGLHKASVKEATK